MTPEIERAWQKAQAAWKAAGGTIPCYDEAYMAARKELSDAYARADAEAKVSGGANWHVLADIAVLPK